MPLCCRNAIRQQQYRWELYTVQYLYLYLYFQYLQNLYSLRQHWKSRY